MSVECRFISDKLNYMYVLLGNCGLSRQADFYGHGLSSQIRCISATLTVLYLTGKHYQAQTSVVLHYRKDKPYFLLV